MTAGPITPDDLPAWVPGDSTLDSAPLGWEGVRIRRWRYTALDVAVPGLSEYMVVAYKRGTTLMNRRCTGDWRNEHVAPGCVSVLTHTAQSHWRWSEDIEVMHLYLSPASMAQIAADIYDRHIRDVELHDVLRADDPVLGGTAACLDREAGDDCLGSRLYVDALRNQACVHILRRYANVVFREPASPGGLSRAQCRLLAEYIDENLDRVISLQELAGVAQLSAFHFTRKFREEFGRPPHAYVMDQRVGRAKAQLGRREIPLKAIAAACGFADQSHMTRIFRRALGVTPAEFRRSKIG